MLFIQLKFFYWNRQLYLVAVSWEISAMGKKIKVSYISQLVNIKVVQCIQVFTPYFENKYSSIKKINNSVISLRTLAMTYVPLIQKPVFT